MRRISWPGNKSLKLFVSR